MKLHTLILACTLVISSNAATCCQHEENAAEETRPDSLHALDATWTDQNDKAFTLADLKGRIVLITMGYTTCKFACPRLAADLIAIEKQLTTDERSKIEIVFVSIDPDHDTPAELKKFLERHHADTTRWHGLTAPADTVLELSVALGIRYRKTGDTDFAHSNIIAVLSPEGEIVKRLEGLGADPADLLAAVRELLAADPR